MKFDPKKLENYPQQPGVYLMKDADGTVLYAGKAKNLKSRLKQYFLGSSDERIQIPYLLENVVDVDTIVVPSEKEALLLENTLIKRYKPKYNVLLKDDKSYLSIKIQKNHKFPLIQLARYKGQAPNDGTYFGPYTSAQRARQMFELISRLFPLRQCSDEEFARRKRPCLLYQIKRCLGPCVGLCTEKEYEANVESAKRLLRGRDQELISELKAQMQEASAKLEFEKAHEILKKIELLESMQISQAVERVHDATSLDVLGLYREAGSVVITKLIYRASKLIGSANFEFEDIADDDSELLQSFILQHYLREEEELAQEIILSINVPDMEIVEEILSEKRGKKVKIFHPQKGEKKKLTELATVNAEAAFKQRKNVKTLREKELLDAQSILNLSRFPRRIECFDNSHLFGTSLVSSMVVFINGEKYKAGYRKYRIQSVTKGDDYGMMREVLRRRFDRAKRENELPDLVVIDGGKGHYNLARDVLSELDIAVVDIIAVAKEEGRHDKGLTQEVVFCPGLPKPVVLDPHSPVLHLLQTIRDEAHRFAIAYHKVTRKKSIIKSALDEVPGIGPVKKKKLLQAFGSVKAIQEATVEDLTKVSGITKKDAEVILNFFKKKPQE
jgi:excinuclease ABC subunit C